MKRITVKPKKPLAMLVGACFVFSLSACQQQTSETSATTNSEKKVTMRAENTYVIGIDDTFAPLEFRGPKGELIGFDIEMAQAASKKLGKAIDFKPIDWSKKDDELNSKKIDMIWSGLNVTDERKNLYLLSKPYLTNEQVVVVSADSNINSIEQLSGKTVGFQSGGPAADYLTNYGKTTGASFNYKEFPEAAIGMSNILQNNIDAYAGDAIQIRFFATNSDGKFKVLPNVLAKTEIAIGFRKGDEALKKEMDGVLDALKADGTEQKIMTKWFGAN